MPTSAPPARFNLARIARALIVHSGPSRSLVNPDGTFTRLAIETNEGLDEHEFAVLETLEAYQGFKQLLDEARVPPSRARHLRRLLPKATPATQRAVARLRAAMATLMGPTRPLDPLAELCSALRDHGLMPSEILELLDVTGLETRPKAGGAHTIQSRIDRVRARRRARAKDLPRSN